MPWHGLPENQLGEFVRRVVDFFAPIIGERRDVPAALCGDAPSWLWGTVATPRSRGGAQRGAGELFPFFSKAITMYVLVCLLTFFLGASSGWAATFYLNPASGSDSNTGVNPT